MKVPEIVVSAKGVANGLSEEYNDGWDFGPDSYSPTSTSAIPYTQTAGWQEGYDYAVENNTKLKILSGTFNFSKTFTISDSGITIEGSGETGKDQTGTVINVTTASIDAIDIDVSSGPENIYLSGFRIVFTTSSTGHGINLINGSSSDTIMHVSTFKNISVHNADPSHYAYNLPYFLFCEFNFLSGYNCGGFMNIGSSAITVADTTGNSLFLECKDGEPNAPTIPVLNINGGVNNGIQLLHFTRLEISGQLNSQAAINIENANRLKFDTVILEDDDTSGTYVAISTNNVQQTSFNNLGLNSAGEGGQINLTDSSYIIFSNISSTNTISPNTTMTTTSSSQIFILNTDLGPLSISGTGISAINTNPYVPTTPSVPASGTAQQNTTPYPVKVYINGGALTEIQITINGTSYTVYSNSTASAVYEGFTLPAGASITLTYSTAPTWSWLPE